MTNKSQTYQELNVELDDILSKLQSADLDIDQAVAVYERGMDIIKKLESFLADAENKITKIKTSFNKA